MNLNWGVCKFLYVWSVLNGTKLTYLIIIIIKIMIMTNVDLHKNQNVPMNPISDSFNK